MPGFADADEWDERTWFGLREEKNSILHGPAGERLSIMYDPSRQLDGMICNTARLDGCVCRLPLHHKGLHIPFTGELIATSGIMVSPMREANDG